MFCYRGWAVAAIMDKKDGVAKDEEGSGVEEPCDGSEDADEGKETILEGDTSSISRRQRYIWDSQYEELPEEVKTRWEELVNKRNTECNKQLKKNVLVNSVVPKETSKTFKVPNKLTASITKLVKTEDKEYDDSWEEGSSIISLKKLYGAELYAQGLASGQIVERMNARGVMMGYEYHEKVKGKLRSLNNETRGEKKGDVAEKDALVMFPFDTGPKCLFFISGPLLHTHTHPKPASQRCPCTGYKTLVT